MSYVAASPMSPGSKCPAFGRLYRSVLFPGIYSSFVRLFALYPTPGVLLLFFHFLKFLS